MVSFHGWTMLNARSLLIRKLFPQRLHRCLQYATSFPIMYFYSPSTICIVIESSITKAQSCFGAHAKPLAHCQ